MKTLQRVTPDELTTEAHKSGGDVELDHAQGIYFLDVSRTLTMWAPFDAEAAS